MKNLVWLIYSKMLTWLFYSENFSLQLLLLAILSQMELECLCCLFCPGPFVAFLSDVGWSIK